MLNYDIRLRIYSEVVQKMTVVRNSCDAMQNVTGQRRSRLP